MSLRNFHLLFILLVFMGADLFGGWALWRHAQYGDPQLLAMGIVSLVGGLGLAVYAWRLVRGFERQDREERG